MSNPRHSAFTLIELLVVISIVALLIAILLPALAAARESGRGIQCMSNQRQVGIAMAAYQTDNEGSFPVYYYSNASGSPYFGSAIPNKAWGNALWKYQYLASAPQVLTCASFQGGIPVPTDINVSLGGSHYGYNYYNLGTTFRTRPTAADRLYVPTRVSDVARPGQTYVLMDAARDLAARRNQGAYVVVDTYSPTTFSPSARHQGDATLNVAYVDGHAAAMPIDDPLNPYIELGQYSTTLENNWDIR